MRTYGLKINDGGGHIDGSVFGDDVFRSRIFLLLHTEAGKYEIFPADHGITVSDLYGVRREYAESMIRRRISDGMKKYIPEVSISGISAKYKDGMLEVKLGADVINSEAKEYV